MGTLAREIGKDLLELPPKVRAELAHKLIQSLDIDDEETVGALWDREIDRRSKAIATGKVKCRPVEDVIADVRRELAHAHPKPSRR